MANEYISPTGFYDYSGSWKDETKAYDGDSNSAAWSVVPPYSWSNYLHLLNLVPSTNFVTPFYCSKLKFLAAYGAYGGGVGISKVDIDIYADDGTGTGLFTWQHLYEGSFIGGVYVEKPFGATYLINQVRIRFYNNGSAYNTAALGDVQWYEAVGKPTVTTNAATDVVNDEATLNGNITNTGGEAPTTRGFKYKEGIAGEEVDASDTGYFAVGAYSKALTGLNPTKKYYFRAYATNLTGGTGYGAWKSFGVDVSIPTVTTSAATSVEAEQATLNGNMTASGGGDATERGFEWKIGATGDIETLPETGVFGVGAYSLVLEDLSANIEYYFRAYALNGAGTGYGSWLSFTTILTDPTVITHNATDELATQVTGNGEIVKTGGADCDERGFEYGLSKTPTWLKNEAAGGYGKGFFDLTIDGLTPNTEYWYRAYAKRYV